MEFLWFFGRPVLRTDRARVNEAAVRLHSPGVDPWRIGLLAGRKRQ